MVEVVTCKHCNSKPKLESVFATGSYYKCAKCNFPASQFPIAQTTGMQIQQWNNLNGDKPQQ